MENAQLSFNHIHKLFSYTIQSGWGTNRKRGQTNICSIHMLATAAIAGHIVHAINIVFVNIVFVPCLL